MIKLISFAAPMRKVMFVIYVAGVMTSLLTTGCSTTFILTKTYHDAATERAVYTPIRASKIEEAYLHSDGVLTVIFSGWNCSRKMQPETEKRYALSIQTKPSADTSEESGIRCRTEIRNILFYKADLKPPPKRMPDDAVSVPIHIVAVDEISRVSVGEFRQSSWDDFASKQVGPGVWIGMDQMQILYVPSHEEIKMFPPLLAKSQGEYARTFPGLIYGYPLAIPVLVAVDIVTIPVKAVAIIVFITTWDGSMF